MGVLQQFRPPDVRNEIRELLEAKRQEELAKKHQEQIERRRKEQEAPPPDPVVEAQLNKEGESVWSTLGMVLGVAAVCAVIYVKYKK
jgi:hypothetical protein